MRERHTKAGIQPMQCYGVRPMVAGDTTEKKPKTCISFY
nr:MAG TPA: hypothetical protein [Caudoviricetes sp.]